MDTCSSNGSGENAWLDLSKSDYAKVIFEKLYWDSDSNEVGCYFNVTESVNKNPSDYLGLFKVGYDEISQCLASKKLSQLDSEEQSKSMYCKFTLDELPDLDGYYQFVYVTQDKEVCGASMPIYLLNKIKEDSSDAEITTEKVEDGFLMVRHGLEQKNHMLETEINKYISETSMLIAKCEKLEQENDSLRSEMKDQQVAHNKICKGLKEYYQDEEKQYLKTSNDNLELKSKLAELQKENIDLKDKLVVIKIKKDVALTKVQNLQKEFDLISSELSSVKKERDELRMNSEILENKNKSTCLKMVALQTERDQWWKKSEMLEKENNSTHLQLVALKIAKAEIADKLQLVKNSFYGLITDTHNHHDYTKILGSDPDLGNILEAIQDKKHSIEQLEDAKCMIKALEDSKSLALKEMSDLAKTLDKKEKEIIQLKQEVITSKQSLEKKSEEHKMAMDNFHKMKCENVALRIYLDVEDKGKFPDECNLIQGLKRNAMRLKSDLQQKSQEILEKEKNILELKAILVAETVFKKHLVEKMKKSNPSVKEESLDKDIQKLLSEAGSMEIELKRKSQEILEKEKSLLELKATLDAETAFKKDLVEKLKKFNPGVKEEFLDKDIQNLLSKAESMEIELKRVSELCKNKDDIIEQINNDMCVATKEVIVGNMIAEANNKEIQNLKNKIEKLSEDCDRKDAFIEKLNNEMKVLEKEKAAAEEDVKEKTVRLLEAAQLYRKQYLKIEKIQKKLNGNNCCASEVSCVSSQSASKPKSAQSTNNSDSDTGEHVRSLTTQPKKEILSSRTRAIFQAIRESHGSMMQSFGACSKSEKTKEESKTESMNLQELQKALSVEDTFDIPCCYCKKIFAISAKSSLPLLEHYENEHQMHMCPVCGELYDKVIPPKYFMQHVDNHFKSQ